MISATLNPLIPFILLYDIRNVCFKALAVKKKSSKSDDFHIVSSVFRSDKNDGEVNEIDFYFYFIEGVFWSIISRRFVISTDLSRNHPFNETNSILCIYHLSYLVKIHSIRYRNHQILKKK